MLLLYFIQYASIVMVVVLNFIMVAVCIDVKRVAVRQRLSRMHTVSTVRSDYIKQTLQLLDKITIELAIKFNGVVKEYDLI